MYINGNTIPHRYDAYKSFVLLYVLEINIHESIKTVEVSFFPQPADNTHNVFVQTVMYFKTARLKKNNILYGYIIYLFIFFYLLCSINT